MPNGEFVHMPVPSCSKQSLVSPSAALEIASSPSEGRKSDVMIISAPNSTVPGQQNREFMEDLESKKPAKIIEDRLAKKQTLLKTPADSSAVAGLRLKIKRKKLADKQIDSSLQSAKKKCTDLQKMSTMILEKSDSKEKSFSEDCSKKFSTVPSSGPGNMQTEEARQRDVGTWVRTVAGAAEAECLRCCEPGTSVTLDGIVWQETSTGVLVVNVTWRGKSYVGTLLDCTKSDWSAPRFCDSPNPDASDGSKGTFKGRNMKRNAGSSSALNSFRNGGSGMCESVSKQNISSNKVGSFSGFEDQKLTPGSPASSVQPNDFILEPSSPLLFECPLSGYEKKFDKIVALKYHQNSSHEFRATRRKDASSCTDPAITGNICTDLRVKGDIFAEVSDETERALQAEVSKNDPKKYLSQAEHESLENLFKVITSTPVPQNNRHQQQKQLNSSSSTLISKTPPVLHVPDEIDGSCSDRERVKHVQSPTAVFSEVSDVEDEAPMLERHSSPLGTILVLKEGTDTSNKRSTSDKCRLDVDGVSVVEKRAADKRGTSAARISGIKNERTESSSPFALQQSDVHPSPLRVKSNPSSSGAAIQTYCNNSKNANYNSSFAVPSVNSFFTLPPVPPPAGAAPSLGLPSGCFDVGGASPGSSAPAFFSVGPPPTAPLSSNLGVVYPSVVGSIMTSPRPPYFGALPTPFGLPLPPNINVIAPSTVTTFVPTAAQNPATFFMPPTTLVTSHKIHQLGDSKKGSPVVLSPKASLSKCSPSSVISGAVRNEISTSSNGTEDAVDSVRSSSPPVQRHHHLHHHTHSYPMLASDPYVALYAGQQAAAAATVVSAYPSYPRK